MGHWYEVPNLLRNGVLARMLNEHPNLKYLMVHNIDTLGVDMDPAYVGLHIEKGAALTTEVITRRIEDRGGQHEDPRWRVAELALDSHPGRLHSPLELLQLDL